jgi:hypothetical protein
MAMAIAPIHFPHQVNRMFGLGRKACGSADIVVLTLS